jgi:flavin-dependent dehydrogenase
MDHHNNTLDSIIDFLIVGGGVAALSVANRLIDLHETPVLIEAGSYPSHKVCGEFISPEALPYLEDWGIIPECNITNIKCFSDTSTLEFTFPKEAAGMSRYDLDKKLAQRVIQHGGTILTHTRVLELKPTLINSETLYQAKLSNGNTILAKNIFIGSGRFFKTEDNDKKPLMPYFGFKAHFSGIDLSDSLHMYLFENGYLGMSHVTKDIVNVACLIKINNEIQDPLYEINRLLDSTQAEKIKEKLISGKMIFDEWLFTKAPAFEAKKNPVLKNVYFIGDAAGTIPPATGNGLGMAITSGYMAADYAINQDDTGFRKAWKKRYGSRIARGQVLHYVMMQPKLTKISFFICKRALILPKMIFSATRES